MRKPISKHAIRRALERAEQDGLMTSQVPIGTLVDHIWHSIPAVVRERSSSKRNGRDRAAIRELPVLVDL